ncbi:MAG: RNA polymerase sigma factor [Pirellulales bacterium]
MTFFCQNLSSDEGMSGPGTDDLGSLFIRATKDGDAAAMDEVMGYCRPALTKRVASWCDKRGFHNGFAEIVACATLMKALGAADSFDPEKPLMGWLVGIARKELAECYRIGKRLDRCESLDANPLPVKESDDLLNRRRRRDILTPLNELIRREDDARRERRRELLDAAIRSLPELKRQVVELYRAGNSVGIIACMLTRPPARVSKILFDAKEELRRRIG